MSAIELKSGKRSEKIEILEREGNRITILLGQKEYHLDLVKVEKNIYSILHGGRSYEIEVVATEKKNRYTAKYICHSYDVEIVDAQMRYMQNRMKSGSGSEEAVISCPMPGKIVKVLVSAGDKVTEGQVVIIVSAMKMESEYKSGKTGQVKEVLVAEGDVIDANMPLIVLE